MINNITIEICIGNLDDAIKVAQFPIDRIELNSALELGGLTASGNTLSYLKENTDLKICCMIRPRGGDFLYSENEFEVMLKDAEEMLKRKADGIVFGFLDENNKVDIPRTKKMAELAHAYGKEAIFHKAFDEIEDLDEACRQLIDCKIDRILTSGKAVYPDILQGCKRIKELNDLYGDRLQFLPGGGVRIENIVEVLQTSNCKQIHMSSKKEHPGGYPVLDLEQLKKMLERIADL